MADKETNDLLRAIAGTLSSIAGGIPNVLRSGPQLLSSIVPEPLRPMVSSLIKSGLGYGLNALTGTTDADIRMSDLLWSTSNQAMRTSLDRAFQRAQFEAVQNPIINPIANELRNTVVGSIYGSNANALQGSGWSKVLGAALQSDIKNFLSDTLSPALAEGFRFRGALSQGAYRNVAELITRGYFSNQYAGMTAADVGAIVADRAKFDTQFGTSEGVRQLHEDLRYISQSLSNIKDIVGEDVTIQQVQQALTAITGSDLTRTSPQTAAAMTGQLSYLNRRFGVTADDWAGATKLMTSIFGQGNITQPLAAALGLGMAETAARTRSNNMFVSDKDLRIAQGIDIAQQEGMGITNNLAAASLVLEGINASAGYRKLLTSNIDISNIDEVARKVSEVSGGRLSVAEARSRLTMFTESGSAMLAERKVQIADDAAYLATKAAINRGKVYADMFKQSVGDDLYKKVFGDDMTSDRLRQMSQTQIEEKINAAMKSGAISPELGRDLISKARMMVDVAGGPVQWANINAARNLSPEQRALYRQAIKRTSQGTLSSRIAAFMQDADENTKLFEAYLSAEPGEAKDKAFKELMTKGGAGAIRLAQAALGQKYSNIGQVDTTVFRDLLDTYATEKQRAEEKAAQRAESTEDGTKATKKGIDTSEQIAKIATGVVELVSCVSKNPSIVAALRQGLKGVS